VLESTKMGLIKKRYDKGSFPELQRKHRESIKCSRGVASDIGIISVKDGEFLLSKGRGGRCGIIKTLVGVAGSEREKGATVKQTASQPIPP